MKVTDIIPMAYSELVELSTAIYNVKYDGVALDGDLITSRVKALDPNAKVMLLVRLERYMNASCREIKEVVELEGTIYEKFTYSGCVVGLFKLAESDRDRIRELMAEFL